MPLRYALGAPLVLLVACCTACSTESSAPAPAPPDAASPQEAGAGMDATLDVADARAQPDAESGGADAGGDGDAAVPSTDSATASPEGGTDGSADGDASIGVDAPSTDAADGSDGAATAGDGAVDLTCPHDISGAPYLAAIVIPGGAPPDNNLTVTREGEYFQTYRVAYDVDGMLQTQCAASLLTTRVRTSVTVVGRSVRGVVQYEGQAPTCTVCPDCVALAFSISPDGSSYVGGDGFGANECKTSNGYNYYVELGTFVLQ